MARKTPGRPPRTPAGRRPAAPISAELLALGRRIHAIRKRRGIVGADTGINPTSLSFIERGRQNVTFTQLVTLAARLGMSVASLVTLPRSTRQP